MSMETGQAENCILRTVDTDDGSKFNSTRSKTELEMPCVGYEIGRLTLNAQGLPIGCQEMGMIVDHQGHLLLPLL